MTPGEHGSEEVLTAWETISAEDTNIIVFVARPAKITGSPALIVIPENLGITGWRQEETQRMAAELGWPVVVLSPYSRGGGKPPAGPFDTPDDRRRAAFLAMPDQQVARDLLVTAAWTREQSYTNGQRPAVLGFCSGGGQAIYAVCTQTGIAACVVSIYGNLVLRGEFTEDRQALDRLPLVPDLDCPVQMHVGTKDFEIPEDDVDRFEEELRRSGKTFEVYRYPGAEHIFADATHPNHDPQATAEMWPRIYRFLRSYSSDDR